MTDDPQSFINFKIPGTAPAWAVGLSVILLILIGGSITFYKAGQNELKAYIDGHTAIANQETLLKQGALKITAEQVTKEFEQKDKEFQLIFQMSQANLVQNAAQAEAINNLRIQITKQGELLGQQGEVIRNCQDKLTDCQITRKGK